MDSTASTWPGMSASIEKLAVVLLAASLVLGLAACGSGRATVVKRTYIGSGHKTEPTFTTTSGETLYWTWLDKTSPASTFSIGDASQHSFVVDKLLMDSSGESYGSDYLPPGKHTVHVATAGYWTITVGYRASARTRAKVAAAQARAEREVLAARARAAAKAAAARAKAEAVAAAARAKAAAARAKAAAAAAVAANLWHQGYTMYSATLGYKLINNSQFCVQGGQYGCWNYEVITRYGCPTYLGISGNEVWTQGIVGSVLANNANGVPPETAVQFELDADTSPVSTVLEDITISCS